MSRPDLAGLVAPLAPIADPAWAVGGGVRDALMGRPVTDLDVAIDGDAARAARALADAAGATRFRLSRAFGAWRVQGGALGAQVDITPLQGPAIGDDLARRDLTVNAMAVDARAPGSVIDPHGGLADVAARRLRMVRPSAFRDDPVRLLRLVRVGEQLGFEVAAATAAAARRDAARVWDAPGERLADELVRIVRLPRPDRAFARMDELGLLGALVPELEACRGLDQSVYHHKDALGHTLEVVRHAAEVAADPEPVFRVRAGRVRRALAEPLADGLTRRDALMLPALLHDMAKPATRAVTPEGRVTFFRHDRVGAEMAADLMARLHTSTRLRDFVADCVRLHLPLGFLVHRTPLSLRQIDRYLRLTAPWEVEIILLTVADRMATRGRGSDVAIRRHLELAREVMDWCFTLRDRGPVVPLLPGDEIAREVGREPGPWLAEVVDALREGQVAGAIRTEAQARRFVRSRAAAAAVPRPIDGKSGGDP